MLIFFLTFVNNVLYKGCNEIEDLFYPEPKNGLSMDLRQIHTERFMYDRKSVLHLLKHMSHVP